VHKPYSIDFINSSGRTGRIGNLGLATSFYNERDEDLGPSLTKTLLETKQVVPDFLEQFLPEGFTPDGSGDVALLKFDADSDDGMSLRNYNFCMAVMLMRYLYTEGKATDDPNATSGESAFGNSAGGNWGVSASVEAPAATVSGTPSEKAPLTGSDTWNAQAAPQSQGWGVTNDLGGW
jgi:ATP-dependent RNA helicase DDX3X